MTQGGGDVQERRNHTYLSKIVTRVLSEALRTVFKRQWLKVYRSPWDDTSKSGSILHNKERLRPTRCDYLPEYNKGNTKEWDCTTLFDAILYSDAIGNSGQLSTRVKDAVHSLRNIRNDFSHGPTDRIEQSVFENAISKIRKCFSDLKVSTIELDGILLEKSKHTSFKVLPDSSGSDDEDEWIRRLRDEIQRFFEELAEESSLVPVIFATNLEERSLAEVGEKWFNNEEEKAIHNTFVMTLNGQNEQTMLQSYKDFSSLVDCEGAVVSAIMTSRTTTKEKILSLKNEVKSKVKNWNSWLLIVTNVMYVTKTLPFLPQSGDDEWGKCRILVSTSDVTATQKKNVSW